MADITKEDKQDILSKWDYIDEVSFSMLNSPFAETMIGESKTLKTAFEKFLGQWKEFRKAVEDEPTID